MGGHEQLERLLNNLRGHTSYAYNRIISSVQGDISTNVLEDPALDAL